MTELRDAYELIRDPDRWTQGAFARDRAGRELHPLDPQAVRWCAAGALMKVGGEWLGEEGLELQKAGELFGSFSYTMANDQLGHEAILQCFEKVLADTEGGL